LVLFEENGRIPESPQDVYSDASGGVERADGQRFTGYDFDLIIRCGVLMVLHQCS
jgi:hypothetical protein